MKSKNQFKQVALIGKYQTTASGAGGASSRQALDEIAHFLMDEGCDVVLESETASNMGLSSYMSMDVTQIGESCDLGPCVGG